MTLNTTLRSELEQRLINEMTEDLQDWITLDDLINGNPDKRRLLGANLKTTWKDELQKKYIRKDKYKLKPGAVLA